MSLFKMSINSKSTVDYYYFNFFTLSLNSSSSHGIRGTKPVFSWLSPPCECVREIPFSTASPLSHRRVHRGEELSRGLIDVCHSVPPHLQVRRSTSPATYSSTASVPSQRPPWWVQHCCVRVSRRTMPRWPVQNDWVIVLFMFFMGLDPCHSDLSITRFTCVMNAVLAGP